MVMNKLLDGIKRVLNKDDKNKEAVDFLNNGSFAITLKDKIASIHLLGKEMDVRETKTAFENRQALEKEGKPFTQNARLTNAYMRVEEIKQKLLELGLTDIDFQNDNSVTDGTGKVLNLMSLIVPVDAKHLDNKKIIAAAMKQDTKGIHVSLAAQKFKRR